MVGGDSHRSPAHGRRIAASKNRTCTRCNREAIATDRRRTTPRAIVPGISRADVTELSGAGNLPAYRAAVGRRPGGHSGVVARSSSSSG